MSGNADSGAISDQVLLELAARGDSQAVDRLLTRYKNLVRRKASMMFMSGADAEDVIQEGMIGLFKAICSYQPEKEVPFQAFAAYCIMAQITDAVRRAGRLKHQLLSPLERRTVLLLIQSLSYQQIAACLDIPVKAVDNALGRARRKFRQYRQEKGKPDVGGDH